MFLREVMNYALEKEDIPKNTAKTKFLTRVFKKSKPLIDPLMADDAARFLQEVTKLPLDYLKVAILLLLNTGMRPEEAVDRAKSAQMRDMGLRPSMSMLVCGPEMITQTYQSFLRDWHAFVGDAGFGGGVRPYALRHTFATRCGRSCSHARCGPTPCSTRSSP